MGVRFHLDVLLRAPILENISSVRHPVFRLNPITTNRFNDMFWNWKTSRVEKSLQQVRVGPVQLNNQNMRTVRIDAERAHRLLCVIYLLCIFNHIKKIRETGRSLRI